MISSIKRSIRSYQGRHFTSRWVRKLFDRSGVNVRIGYPLAIAAFIFITIEPTAYAVNSERVQPTIPPNEIITGQEIKTEHTITWPVKSPRITQGYRFGHKGIDMQDASNLTIYPIDDGTVTSIIEAPLGYGKHVFIDHGDGRSSLYAHLSSISVQVGQLVNRDTSIGIMGKTGWASGVHLHLEIYQNGVAFNPISLLPALSQTIASSK